MNEPSVRHVSDTALWVAAYRAHESERPDALFHDRFAKVLAGERGYRIAREIPGGWGNAWSVIVRTAVIDELLGGLLRDQKIDCVLNLAAGLDTRPYRMDLPADLHWVEVDLPELIAYKQEKLAGEKARCRLEQIALDLSNRAARQMLFARVALESRRVLVLTEGLLPYLSPESVDAMTEDLGAHSKLEWWIQDYYSSDAVRRVRRRWKKVLERAPFLFQPSDWMAFFSERGWKVAEERPMLIEARRLKREMKGLWIYRLLYVFMSRSVKERALRSFGCVLLKKA